ncbi:MAG: hypothetical protein WCH34_09300 [Bacteroidota bacterium]
MKKLILILIIGLLANSISYSQNNEKLDDFGRIVLNTYLSDKIDIPTEAKNLLITKLSQIASNYGMGGSAINPRFIITANINIGTKDIIAGPPQMIAQNIELTLFIGDAIENKSFCNTTISLKGVGMNENKAFIDALKKINPKNKEISLFVEEGKTKIISYYNSQCDFIIKDAFTLKKQGKYDEAIYKLSLVPEVCKDCYFKCLDTLTSIYQEKIDNDCAKKLNDAKAVWAANSNKIGAENAVNIISEIDPLASCKADVQKFISQIQAKLAADEKAAWEFKIKKYNDKIAKEKELRAMQAVNNERNFELDKLRIDSYQKVSIEYAKNQPKTITYNNINWR